MGGNMSHPNKPSRLRRRKSIKTSVVAALTARQQLQHIDVQVQSFLPGHKWNFYATAFFNAVKFFNLK